MKTRKGSLSDIPGVLALQEKNLFANLSEEERKAGFVTTPFTIPQLETIITAKGLFVAEDKDEIIAYIFAGTWEYFFQWAIFPFMASRLPELSFNGQSITTNNSFQYGPVCIALEYRGQGLFQKLFEEMRSTWLSDYSISITFINQVNDRSTKAHTQKLGWEIIDEFDFNGGQYFGLAYDMNRVSGPPL